VRREPALRNLSEATSWNLMRAEAGTKSSLASLPFDGSKKLVELDFQSDELYKEVLCQWCNSNGERRDGDGSSEFSTVDGCAGQRAQSAALFLGDSHAFPVVVILSRSIHPAQQQSEKQNDLTRTVK
jgi:hypothetical protein